MKNILGKNNKFISIVVRIISNLLNIILKLTDIFLNFLFSFIVISYYVKYGILSVLFIFIIFYLLYKFNKEYLNFSGYYKITVKLLILSFIFINIIFVFYYNKSYYQVYKSNNSYENDNTLMCTNEVFNDSIEMPAFAVPPRYKYHTPKSNPLLPTLGIRYKETYEEERGIVVIYEKRSYFNIYVGEGKVLCSSMETLE